MYSDVPKYINQYILYIYIYVSTSQIQTFMLVLAATTLIHPVYILISYRRDKHIFDNTSELVTKL